MVAEEYADLTVVSIAANGGDMAFSSDTGMAECLVVARKLGKDETTDGRIRFASLASRPAGLAQSAATAALVAQAGNVRKIEDGPYGGSPIEIGDETAGSMLETPVGAGGESWAAVRVSDYSLAQTAFALANSELRVCLIIRFTPPAASA